MDKERSFVSQRPAEHVLKKRGALRLDAGFGIDILQRIELRKGLASLLGRQASESREISRGLYEAFERIFNDKDVDRVIIQEMIEEALHDPEVLFTFNEDCSCNTFEEFVALFNDKKISSKTLEAILLQRERRQGEIQKEWEPKFNAWKDEFKEQLAQAIADGLIPNHQDRYSKRIDEVKIGIIDPLLAVTKSRHGLFSSEGDAVFINIRGNEKKVRHIFFHEMVHAISGQAIQKIILTPEEEDYRIRKIGLRFIKNVKWLNEGLTEFLAKHFSGTEEGGYLFERNKIIAIIKNNEDKEPELSIEDFFDAYFEIPTEQPVEGSFFPAFRKLNAKMTKIYGAGWLKNIEKEIRIEENKNSLSVAFDA